MVFLHCIGCKAIVAQVQMKVPDDREAFRPKSAISCRKKSMIGQHINVFTAT